KDEAAGLTITPAGTRRAGPASPTALDLDESERIRTLELDENAVADFHGMGFEPDPRLLPECVDPRRKEFLAQMLDTPEFRSLHTSTALNPAASAIAAGAFAEQFAALKKEEQ